MEIKTFRKGEVIFREGEPGESMYDVCWGRVGIYKGYGTDTVKKVAELLPEQFFGEMGLLEKLPRSATAVALDDNTQLWVITEENFLTFFEKNPARVYMILEQLSHRLRRTTQDYLEACHSAVDLQEKEETGRCLSLEAEARLRLVMANYNEFRYMM